MQRVEVIRAGRIPYGEAWTWQREIHGEVASRARPDTVLLLEHPSVYTAGLRTEPWERPSDGTPVIDVDRGGKITWHGPGQLVGYPILRLPDPNDVVGYVRRIERMLRQVCADLGLTTRTVVGRPGLWLPAAAGTQARKIAAIGVRVANGVTQHGFAINANPDLSCYNKIIPCGIAEAGVTSLTKELGRLVAVQDILPVVERRLPMLTVVPCSYRERETG